MLTRLLTSLTLFGMSAAEACAVCGLNKTFSPKMFFISLGFVALPWGAAAYIGWRVYKDHKRRKAAASSEGSAQ